MSLQDLQDLLPEIRSVFPDAVIAGGAPRDAYFGVQIKDIDVMTSNVPDLDTLRTLADRMGGRWDLAEPQDPSGDAVFEYEIHFSDGTPRLNIIDLSGFEITDPVDNLHDFDFALSQIAVTPNGVIHTPAFIADALAGTCTYTGDCGKEQWRIDSSKRRLQRLKVKYPNRLFMNCAGLE